MSLDTRAQSNRILGSFVRDELAAVAKTLSCGILALTVAAGPGWIGWDIYAGLAPAGRATLGILVFAACLWITEAMPAFAVALLVIGLEIGILGRPGGIWAAAGDNAAWTTFVKPWSSPTMWLFLGGFVLAHGCSKTHLDRWLSVQLLGRLGSSPSKLIAGIMAVTFVFSMFMSNTATAAMMFAVTAPLLADVPAGGRFGRGLILAVATGANLGGIGTIIGTPPNAIAVGELAGDQRIDFIHWMLIALPPALVMAVLAYAVIWWKWLRDEPPVHLCLEVPPAPVGRQSRHRFLMMGVLFATVVLWMSESWLGIPSPVVSFIPIVVLAVTGVIDADDMRGLPWDVLLLLAGGLSLGVAVEVTGLAHWLAGQVPGGLSAIQVAAAFALLGLLVSNLMSNTAAAAILIPLGSSMIAPGGIPRRRRGHRDQLLHGHGFAHLDPAQRHRLRHWQAGCTRFPAALAGGGPGVSPHPAVVALDAREGLIDLAHAWVFRAWRAAFLAHAGAVTHP